VSARLLTWRLISLAAWAVAMMAIVLASVTLPEAYAEGGRGTLAYDAKAARFGGKAAHRLIAFQPDSPLPAAGISAGDLLVDPPRGRLIDGEPVQLQVAHDGKVRIVEVRAIRAPPTPALDIDAAFGAGVGLLALLLGTLLVVRRWHDEPALALGSAMLISTASVVPAFPRVGNLAASFALWSSLAIPLFLILMTWVGLLMSPAGSRVGQWVARCSIGVTVALLGWACIVGWYFFGNGVPAIDFFLNAVRSAFQFLALVLGIIAFAHAWRSVEGGQRERLRWLFVGFASALMALGLVIGGILFQVSDPTYVALSIATDVFASAALGIIAYAILRQRVIDVGFAINRAIVYAVLTGLMLVGFGVVEWLVDHVLEFENRKKSALVDGALAVGIFLVMHRLQHSISHNVQRVFFRSWHKRAEALDRFLEMSEHFTEPEGLLTAFLEALDAFTESVGSALYARDPQGRLVLMRATLAGAPPMLSGNDLAVVKLKAAPSKPQLIEMAAERNAENWVFPLARRGELVGFVRIGEKRNRDLYRPDQIERIARAVRQVGFDLYALRLERAARVGVRALPEQRPASSHP
jgi:hypothetical protein